MKTATKHFIFNYQPDSTAEDMIGSILSISEESFEKIVNTLGIKKDFPKIKYYFYQTEEIKIKKTGEEGNANTIRDKFEIHAVYNDEIKAIGPHEIVHLLTNHLGVPNYVFNEGLAEHFEDYWKAEIDGKLVKMSHDDWIRRFLKNKEYLSITTLFDDSKFWEVDDGKRSYPECGSFVKYLAKKHGLNKVMTAYGKLKRKNPDKTYNYQVFKDVFGTSVEETEKEWVDYLKV